MNEAKTYIEKEDLVQASEKLYKITEECIKTLAQLLQTPEYKKAIELNKWSILLLDEAAVTLSEKLNEFRIRDAWTHAYFLHVEGVHEARINIKAIKIRKPIIEWLLKYVEKLVKE